MRRIICDATPKNCAAVLPRRVSLIDQSKIRFVHERRGLQDLIVPFAAEVGRRAAAKLLIHERHEPLARLTIAPAPGAQQCRHVDVGLRPHGSPILPATSRDVNGLPAQSRG